jgi:hypothetical protein
MQKRAVKKTTRSVSEPFGPLRVVQTVEKLALHGYRLGLLPELAAKKH